MFEILSSLVLLRERLRPYIEEHMKIASETGCPVMRPMFYDYPNDEICYTLGTQYMFGDDILFAPITEHGMTERSVYLPEGDWILTSTSKHYCGGKEYTVRADINEFIAFVKSGADVIDAFNA